MEADPAAPAPIEVELKLEVRDTGAGRRLLASDELDGFRATEPTRTIDVDDRYLDTAGRRLEKAGRVARLRDVAGVTILTVKSLASPVAGAVHRREELEGPATADLEPRSWPPSVARSMILELAGDAPLEELVSIHQRRRVRRFVDAGTTIELSLDRVAVVRNGHELERFVELEAELRGGDEDRLVALGERLSGDPDFSPARASKLERALAAVERARREAVRPRLSVGKTPGVTATDTLAEAGRKVMAFHFERLLAREAGTREGRDPEELHQMRVATRRLRAAWRTFGDAYDPAIARRLRRRLRDTAMRLGAVRDLDVLLEDARAHRATLPDAEASAFSPLVLELERRRETARAALARALDEPAFGRWINASVAFLSTPGQGARPVPTAEPGRVRELAPARIWAAYGRVRAYEEGLGEADVATLHALRIEAKRLRYALEFVREALGPGATAVIEPVTALQDHLGRLHDTDVAAAVARNILAETAGAEPAQRDAITAYASLREGEMERLQRTAGRPFRRLTEPAFRRRLGRVLAGL
jgi:CHAD domain-containing protein